MKGFKRPTHLMKFAVAKWGAVVGTFLVARSLARAQLSPVPLPRPARAANNYQAPEASRARLGKINDLLKGAMPVNRQFKGLKKMLRLPDGTLFIDADLDTDADGSPRATEIDPKYGQLSTSLSFAGQDDERQWVNSEEVPYIVLPLEFYKDMGIGLGDVAAVIWRGRVVYAIFADVGPKDLIGEGSVALSEGLGFDPWKERDGTRQIVSGIESDVLMIVFPGSAPDGLTVENINQKTIERAKPLFETLGGKTD